MLIAGYALNADSETTSRRIESVHQRYERVFGSLQVSHAKSRGAGVVALLPSHTHCFWSFWHEDAQGAAATGYVPFGTGDLSRESDTGTVHRLLTKDPSAISKLDPPFSLVSLDKESGSIEARVDLIGYGRLYWMTNGCEAAVSNRLAALPLLLGVRAEVNLRGWQYLAAAGWFMGNSTAIKRASALAPGSTAIFRSGTPVSIRQDAGASEWFGMAGNGLRPGQDKVAAEHLVETFKRIGALWEGGGLPLPCPVGETLAWWRRLPCAPGFPRNTLPTIGSKARSK